jgi:hypothetical protein
LSEVARVAVVLSKENPMKCTWMLVCLAALAAAGTFPAAASADFLLLLGAEERVEANGADIVVSGYSVPSFEDWDGDGLSDIIVGEGSGISPLARVRVYPNVGIESDPSFEEFFYVQSAGSDLTGTGAG